MKVDYTSNLNVNLKCLGLEVLLIPYLQFISSQRSTMFCSNISQAIPTEGNEPPHTMTGLEHRFGKYEFDNTVRDQDIEILDIIPKFKVNLGVQRINTNPSLTVVYVGQNDRKVGCFNIDTHTVLSDHFGYINKWTDNIHHLKLNSFIPKDMKFITSPIHKGDMYCPGINANVANMTIPEVAEDAFVVSKSFADKLTHIGMDTLELSLSQNHVPLNLFGSEDEYKFIPDVGEVVGDDGILMATRKINDDSFITDMTDEALTSCQFLHDRVYPAPPGSVITDIQVYTNPKIRSCKGANNNYSQILKYQEQHYEYYRSIIKAYENAKKKGYIHITDKFNSLVTKAIGILPSKDNKIVLMDKREPVSFAHIKITYMFERRIHKGAKLTGRDGQKGTISDIWDDELMPIDDNGIRADLIIAPESGFNRMIMSQSYESFFNRGSNIIRQRIINNEIGDIDQTYNYILDYVGMINPNMVDTIENYAKSHSREEVIETIKETWLYLIIPPFLNTIKPELALQISEKFNIKETPVTYGIKLSDGSIEYKRTKENVCIGSKYILLLSKIPQYQMSSTEVGYVSQFKIPHKVSDKQVKVQSPIGETPIRFGEDESAALIVAVDKMAIGRFMGTQANSSKIVSELSMRLIADKYPTKLDHIDVSTEDIIKNNNVIGLANHLFGCIGISIE